ncbi:MAG: 5'/3'-nucleotidase SurE [Clostridiales bacterium]|nr:5'/3'-nucleotidase SurE [Clostridiales bacterium]
MHILISNDDGIFSPGLLILTHTALERGHRVTVSAPATQQSAMSHRLTIANSLLAKPYDIPGARAYAVDGSPVDCVRLGSYLAEDDPIDFCLSGINDGTNLGSALYYSGTAAAAREAAMLNIPSMALSIGVNATDEMLNNLSEFALDLLPRLHEKSMPRLTFLNINVESYPISELKGPRICPASDSFYTDRYIKRINPRGVPYFWIEAGMETEPVKPNTDIPLCKEGYITCTFVGGFADNNHLYDGIFGSRED